MQKRRPVPLTVKSRATGCSSTPAATPAARTCRPGRGPRGWKALREPRPLRDRFPSTARSRFDDLPALQYWRQSKA